MLRLGAANLRFGTVVERIAPESLTHDLVPLRSPQHIAQTPCFDTRSSLQRVDKRRFWRRNPLKQRGA
jgi:hypothetical protein